MLATFQPTSRPSRHALCQAPAATNPAGILSPRVKQQPDYARQDDLRSAKGIVVSLALIIPFWAAIACLCLR